MSDKKNNVEAKRWLDTARDDLEAAEILAANNKFSHSCFLCQQAVEKAVKSLHYKLDSDPWGHSIQKLISALENVAPKAHEKLVEFQHDALLLDRFYIPARYPNGLPGLIPAEAYVKEDAEQAIQSAKAIINRIKTNK